MGSPCVALAFDDRLQFGTRIITSESVLFLIGRDSVGSTSLDPRKASLSQTGDLRNSVPALAGLRLDNFTSRTIMAGSFPRAHGTDL